MFNGIKIVTWECLQPSSLSQITKNNAVLACPISSPLPPLKREWFYSFFNCWERGCINIHNQEIEKERKERQAGFGKRNGEIVERDSLEQMQQLWVRWAEKKGKFVNVAVRHIGLHGFQEPQLKNVSLWNSFLCWTVFLSFFFLRTHFNTWIVFHSGDY